MLHLKLIYLFPPLFASFMQTGFAMLCYPCEERKEWYEFYIRDGITSLQYDHCTYIHTRLTIY